MKLKKKSYNHSTLQLSILFLLRIAIGWHFLYEGITKLLTPDWSSVTYLHLSRWILGDFFNWIASTPSVLQVVDFLNIWGLILIGLGLIFGFFTRIASISGMFLLLLYYVANPPFIGYDFGIPTEGNYLIVDKNFIEFIALGVLVLFPASNDLSLDHLFVMLRKMVRNKKLKPVHTNNKNEKKEQNSNDSHRVDFNRREIIKNLAALPLFGAFVFAVLKKMGWESYEEKHLEKNMDVVSGATIKTFNFSGLKDLKGKLPYGRIGDLQLSRVILGGNLIAGWAHARDLIYVSKLVKSYHTKEKIFETFLLSEKCGINCFLTNPVLCQVITEYWKRRIGNIQFISDCSYNGDLIKGIKISIDSGAHSCYVHGGIADKLVMENKIEEIAAALELIKQNGVPAGIGAHSLETVKACVDYGLKPDYWMKTLHHTDYWSAKPKQQNDNIWCTNPEETIEYMKNLEQPWIAYKILAAGAIHPKAGFQYAFENGADFICVGMYDFQIVDDVNIALNALANTTERERPWIT